MNREDVLKRLRYEPETGALTWLIDLPSANRKAGDTAGMLHQEGYIRVTILGHTVLAHRLAWFMMTGKMPRHQIDHINGVRDDNRWTNLRDVEPRINCENKRNLVGASFERESGKWRAQITVMGVNRTIGRFETREEATAAYLQHKRSLHQGCTI